MAKLTALHSVLSFSSAEKSLPQQLQSLFLIFLITHIKIEFNIYYVHSTLSFMNGEIQSIITMFEFPKHNKNDGYIKSNLPYMENPWKGITPEK